MSQRRRRDSEPGLAEASRKALRTYRRAVQGGTASAALRVKARRALLYLGGNPDPASGSLKDYDFQRFGPFLGVSDDGGAAEEIRDAGLASPKARALSKSRKPTPLQVGLAVDAERLGGVGEVAVGPEEYADVWLACVDRVLISTNVGTRVNLRVYRREPRILLRGAKAKAMADAKQAIAAAFKPYVETPDRQTRPLTVFVEFPVYSGWTLAQRRGALRTLARYVSSGQAAGTRTAPKGQSLGFAIRITTRRTAKSRALAAIDLAAQCRIRTVLFDGVRRKAAEAAISLAGLLDYFAPGLAGPLLRRAQAQNVALRTANLPDTDTIARSIWVGLSIARSMGADLGKYGCFPLTRREIDHVVHQVQGWMRQWSAAPVFFVDQGLISEKGVDTLRDLPRGIETWLSTVARRGARVVLIDTIDKASGHRLLKRNTDDRTGYLGWRQIERIEKFARRLDVRVLWAGGLGLRDAFEMGKLGVFGIYVTSAAAMTIPVRGTYVRDPGLPSGKKASRDAVHRTKTLLEAGFLSGQLAKRGAAVESAAQELLTALDAADVTGIRRRTQRLATICERAWHAYWKGGPWQAN